MATAEIPAGFEDAFDPLFHRATAVARRIVVDAAAAEDVAAETLARAFAHWKRIGDQPWREGWVVRVATNLAIDAVRARNRHDEHHRTGTDDTAVSGEADAVVARVVVVDAVRALPRRQREVVGLRYLTGLSEAEAAEALQVSPGAVKTHLHRGMARLRERLGPDAPLEIEEALVDG